MKALAEFTKTTLIGGLLICQRVYAAVLLPAEAMKGACASPAGSPVLQTTS